ncbi:hypothetical protein KUTeg_005468 [Tegillarca granosa]|uniref:Uncharacterized protein n=1 Tax=Tegillarca granosa TaxID=220873 RepID=A0ABQ9FJT6_TEGGR|nr:hypothetical protein KUTeg_005468 [Tegillarca granosa]
MKITCHKNEASVPSYSANSSDSQKRPYSVIIQEKSTTENALIKSQRIDQFSIHHIKDFFHKGSNLTPKGLLIDVSQVDICMHANTKLEILKKVHEMSIKDTKKPANLGYINPKLVKVDYVSAPFFQKI